MFITLEDMDSSFIRCDQCGDWQWNNNILTVAADKKLPYKSLLLVLTHEMVEAILCKEAGITDEQVVAFDLQFEKERAAGLHSATAEDGDDPRAPYHEQHLQATAIEMMMCSLLGMSWREHELAIDATQ